LKDNMTDALYEYKSYEVADLLMASVKLNVKHAIFSGHFPDMPVLPGACMVALVKELLEKESGKKVLIKESDIKFLGIVNPQVDSLLSVEVRWKERSEKAAKINGQMTFNDIVVFKISARIETI